MKRKLITIIILAVFISLGRLAGQTPTISAQEQQLKVYFDSLYNSQDKAITQNLADTIASSFRSLLQNPESFSYPFDTLEYARKIFTKDKQLAILTYSLLRPDNSYLFHGFIQHKQPSGTIKLTELYDRSDSIENPEKQQLTPKKWYGAYYYKILTTRHNDKTLYTLLGWDGHNMFTNRKVIEIIRRNNFGDWVFGVPVIQAPDGIKHRRIFRFSEQAVMTLRYDKRMDMIIYDHLAPQSAFYKGQYQYYGPDFTQDGLKFKSGRWLLKSNVEATNPRQ